MTKQYATLGEAIDASKARTKVVSVRTMQDAHVAGEVKAATARFRNIRYAHKPFEKLTDDEFYAKYYKRTHRRGKTERDHKGGYRARNIARKQARVQWQNDAKFNLVPEFPG